MSDIQDKWESDRDFRGDRVFVNNHREMMIVLGRNSSTLAKENEIYIEFAEGNHFLAALNKSDEIWGQTE